MSINTHNDLELNIEYILGLTNYNGIINHSSQHTVRIVCVNAKVVPMTLCQDLSGS